MIFNDSPPDSIYDLTDGFGFERTSFQPNGRQLTSYGSVSPETYAGFDQDDSYFENEVAEELSRNTYRSSDNTLEYSLLEGRVPSGVLEIIGLHWGGQAHDPETIKDLAYKRRADLDSTFLVFDHFGAGGSAVLPRSIGREMVRSRSFAVYGELIDQALKPTLADFDHLHYRGRSMGGLAVMAMAAAANYADSIVVYDAPGSREHSRRQFLQAFLMHERAHGLKYMESSLEHEKDDCFKKVCDDLSVVKGIFDFIALARRPAALEAQWWSLPNAMRRDQLANAVSAAAPAVQDSLTVLSPTLSAFNRPQDVHQILANVAGSSKRPKHVQQIVFPGTHAFSMGTPAALVALENRAAEVAAVSFL